LVRSGAADLDARIAAAKLIGRATRGTWMVAASVPATTRPGIGALKKVAVQIVPGPSIQLTSQSHR
jgi:hypothetical protein